VRGYFVLFLLCVSCKAGDCCAYGSKNGHCCPQEGCSPDNHDDPSPPNVAEFSDDAGSFDADLPEDPELGTDTTRDD